MDAVNWGTLHLCRPSLATLFMKSNQLKQTATTCLTLIACVVHCSLASSTACSSHGRETSCWRGSGRSIAWAAGGGSSRLRTLSTSSPCPGTRPPPRPGTVVSLSARVGVCMFMVCVRVFMLCVFAGAWSEKQKEWLKMNTPPEYNCMWSGKVLGRIWKTKGSLHLLKQCKTSRFIVSVLGSGTGFTLVSEFDKIQRAGCEHAVVTLSKQSSFVWWH